MPTGRLILQSLPSAAPISAPLLSNFLSAFGTIVHLEAVNGGSPLQFRVEFLEADGLFLATQILCNTASPLGTLTFLPLHPASFKEHQPKIDSDHRKPNQGSTCPPIKIFDFNSSADPKILSSTSPSNLQRTYQVHLRSPSDSNALSVLLPSSCLSRASPEPSADRGETDLRQTRNTDHLSITPAQFLKSITRPLVHNHSLPSESQHIYLLLHTLDLESVKISWILTLLNTFGNVSCYLIDHLTSLGVFSFTTPGPIDSFIDCMNGLLFFGRPLAPTKVTSPVSLSDFRPQDSPRLTIGAENPKNNRYQSALDIRFNLPSALLHITNVDAQLDSFLLQKALARVHPPLNLIRLRKKSTSNSTMFLAEFGTVSQATEVLATLHNKNIGEKSVKISYSRPKTLGTLCAPLGSK